MNTYATNTQLRSWWLISCLKAGRWKEFTILGTISWKTREISSRSFFVTPENHYCSPSAFQLSHIIGKIWKIIYRLRKCYISSNDNNRCDLSGAYFLWCIILSTLCTSSCPLLTSALWHKIIFIVLQRALMFRGLMVYPRSL
jgi:hypothetical protein